MCSIVVGWRWDQHCGDGVGRRSEGTGWDGTKLCRQKVSMGKMSAGTGGDGYEITYPCKTSCQCESCTGTNSSPFVGSDVNKDWTCKDKDQAYKDKD